MLTDRLRMPRRFLRGNGLRLALTVFALALGVALVAAMDLANRAVLRSFTDVIDGMAGRAALQVSAGSAALFPEETAEAVARVAGVELALPVVSATAFTAEGVEELLTVHGFTITDDEAVRVYETAEGGWEVDDELAFLNQADSLAVTRTFAARRGLHLGSPLVLETPHGQRAFTVRALIEPTGIAKLLGGSLVLMDLYAAEAAFTEPGLVNRIDVVVRSDADVERVAADIRAALPAGLVVEAPAERKAEIHKVMQSLHAVLQGVAFVGLIAAFLISFNRLSTVFEERAWLLGVMRAVGLGGPALRRQLLHESLLLGLIGVALGLPLGVVLARLLAPVIATTTATAHQITAPDADLQLRPASFLLAGLTGLAAAVLAALVPAWRASRVAAIDTIRSRGREQAGARRRAALVALIVVVVLIPVSIVLQSVTHAGVWGVVATILIALATALLARPLITLLDAIPIGALGGTGRFARDAISQHPRRASLTAGMLGVGLGAVLWLWMIAGSFEATLMDVLGAVLRADLVVGSARAAGGHREWSLDGGIVDELRSIPGVRAVAGQRTATWMFAGGPISITAWDAVYYSDLSFGEHPVAHGGPWTRDDLIAGRAVWASRNFPTNIGLGVGDLVALDGPGGRLRLPIAALTDEFDSPRGVLLMERDLYRRLFLDDEITRVHVMVAPGVPIAEVRDEIQRRLGVTHKLRVSTAREVLEYYRGHVRQAFRAVDVLALGVLVVVLVGLADTLAAGVADRTQLFGAMRAVGARGAHVQRLVVAEAILLGAVGLILALGCGLALGALWVEATFTYLIGWTLELHLPLRQLALLVAITFAVCILAALLPARHAARIGVGDALRTE